MWMRQSADVANDIDPPKVLTWVWVCVSAEHAAWCIKPHTLVAHIYFMINSSRLASACRCHVETIMAKCKQTRNSNWNVASSETQKSVAECIKNVFGICCYIEKLIDWKRAAERADEVLVSRRKKYTTKFIWTAQIVFIAWELVQCYAYSRCETSPNFYRTRHSIGATMQSGMSFDVTHDSCLVLLIHLHRERERERQLSVSTDTVTSNDRHSVCFSIAFFCHFK